MVWSSSLGLVCLLVASSNAFILPSHPRANRLVLSKPPTPLTQRQAVSVEQVEELLSDFWVPNVPRNIDEVCAQAADSLDAALSNGPGRLRVDIKVPGLDDQYEQTANRDKALLLGVVAAFFPVLAQYNQSKILFSSEGEVNLAYKAYDQGGFELPQNIKLASLLPGSVSEDDEVLFCVEPSNRNGDPVVLKVEEIANKAKGKVILFNPDLDLHGTLGIRERDRRRSFVESFKAAYTFITLSSLSRTSLIPRELGALAFDFGIKKHRLLRCLLPDGAEGPGSLNRWMRRQIYEMGPKDPTADNPPKYFVVREWEERPEKEELGVAMAGSAEILQQKVLEAIERIDTVEQARDVLIAAADSRTEDPSQVLKAISFLEKKNRKEQKDLDAAEGASQLLKDINGAWNLIFTTGTKSTQEAVGSINYFPVKAVQRFNSATGDYSNSVYLGPWAAVNVLGRFTCPSKKKLSFTVQSIALGPFKLNFASDGFFTFFYVDDRIAVARGQGGGLALWSKEIGGR